MKLMVCFNGEPLQLVLLPEIYPYSAGIELGSYGLSGIRSEQAWQDRLNLHRTVGAVPRLAGGSWALYRDGVCAPGSPDTSIHRAPAGTESSPCGPAQRLPAPNDTFHLQDSCLERNVRFRQQEIWRTAGERGWQPILQPVPGCWSPAPDLRPGRSGVGALDGPTPASCFGAGHEGASGGMHPLKMWLGYILSCSIDS